MDETVAGVACFCGALTFDIGDDSYKEGVVGTPIGDFGLDASTLPFQTISSTFAPSFEKDIQYH